MIKAAFMHLAPSLNGSGLTAMQSSNRCCFQNKQNKKEELVASFPVVIKK